LKHKRLAHKLTVINKDSERNSFNEWIFRGDKKTSVHFAHYLVRIGEANASPMSIKFTVFYSVKNHTGSKIEV
jgi:hypothetical protein